MFGWRKKNQGFEWHQYVRTTIKHRRDDRRQRVEKVKKDAIDGVKGAGKAGVAVGARGAKAAWRGLLAMPGAAFARFAPGISRSFGRTTGAVADIVGGIYDSLPPLSTQLAKPGVRSLLCLTGLVAAGSGAVRVQTVGFDRDAKLALSCAALLGVAALIPLLSVRGLGLQIGKFTSKFWGRGLAGVGATAALLWVGSLVAGQTGVAGLSKSKFSIAKLRSLAMCCACRASWSVSTALKRRTGSNAAAPPRQPKARANAGRVARLPSKCWHAPCAARPCVVVYPAPMTSGDRAAHA
jgi:hypothetical protein